MDYETMAIEGAGIAFAVLDFAFPAAGPIISIAKAAIPALIAAQPYIVKAVQDGKSAIEAGEAASPGLKAQLSALVSEKLGPQAAVTQQHLETIVRASFGLPRMTPEQEMKWMDDATPNHDSTFGG